MSVNKSERNCEAVPVDAELIEWIKERQGVMRQILTPGQEKLMRLRFGLDDGRTRTRAELSEILNNPVEQVVQTEAFCLRLLRHPKNRV